MIIDNALFSEEIPEKGATEGHLRFHLKDATPENVALIGFCANITASLLFERLQAQGTNIIIALNKDTAQIDVIARSEDDGLNLTWPAKSMEPTQLNDIAERIKNKTFFIGKEQQKEEKVPEAKPEKHEIPELSEAEEDYLVKQLHRIP